MLSAFGLTASATELGCTRAALVGSTQKPTTGLSGTCCDKEALLFYLFLFVFRAMADIVQTTCPFGLDIVEHR